MTSFPSAEEFIAGQILLINKPIGWSSFRVVKKIRAIILQKCKLKKLKVGHAGTLDPLATGLLILCTGKLTKTISKIQNQDKTYMGTITIGGASPSYDLETPVDINYNTAHISEEAIYNTTKKFIGEIKQKPPIFSALKQNGERLYKKARRGEKTELCSRIVHVKKFSITSIKDLNVEFEITCGKGTYIRSIANDFGLALNSGAYLSQLCRTAIGNYELSNSMEIKTFEML